MNVEEIHTKYNFLSNQNQNTKTTFHLWLNFIQLLALFEHHSQEGGKQWSKYHKALRSLEKVSSIFHCGLRLRAG